MRRIALATLAMLALSSPACATACYVSEFTQAGEAGVQVARQAGSDQTPIAVSGVSAQSAAFGSATKLVRLNCDVVVSFAFGANPTATTSSARLPIGVVEYFQVRGTEKLAVISNN
jgi:hypothetical protein